MLKQLLILSSFIFSVSASANLLENGDFDQQPNDNSFRSVASAHQNAGTERYLNSLDQFKNWGIFNSLPG